MLLTLSASNKPDYDFKPPHDFQSPTSTAAKRYSPTLHTSFSIQNQAPNSAPPASESARNGSMSGPHRGLPPPAAMTLPDPHRGPPSVTPSLGAIPNPPSQWQGAEESMRNWLVAKAEEDRRRQEEERTRQESLRLEQRKIESSMLRDSMAGGVPPHMVPIIFAGMGGASLANLSVDWLQQYGAQLQASQQQHLPLATTHQASPESRLDSRLINPPQYSAAPPHALQALPPQQSHLTASHAPVGQPGNSLAGYSSTAGSMSPRSRAHAQTNSGPTSAPRQPGPGGASTLPRLTTNEMPVQQAPSLPAVAPQQDNSSSSPSIYFHHWVPPASQSSSGPHREVPATPSDYSTSPKKRKDVRAHQAPPAPTSAPSSQPQYTSPPFSQQSSNTSTPAGNGRSRHGRRQSDQSASRPISSTAALHGRPGTAGAGENVRHTTPPASARDDPYSRNDIVNTSRREHRDRTGSVSSRVEHVASPTLPGSPGAKVERR